MRRLLACLCGVFLAAGVWPAPQPFAQQEEAAQRQKAAEFARLYEGLEQSQDPEQKLALAEQALKLERDLRQWPFSIPREAARAGIWRVLGNRFLERTRGDRAENLERAIAAYIQALQIYTADKQPVDWAWAQHNIGHAYTERIRGDRAENLEKAIAAHEAALTVFKRETLPREWVQTQVSLAIAYRDRVSGDRANNLETAIVHLEGMLVVATREAMPKEWARAHSSLAGVYRNRIRGDRTDNIDKSITHLEAALTVSTREALPHEWAMVQNNLAIVYKDRIRGDRADNLEKAIAAYESALTVFTRVALPREWAKTQNNLAISYADRVGGDRADNLEKAIATYEAALTVRTRDALPREWADTQLNLAVAYQARIRGDRTDNIEKAITHLEAALTVKTREALPHEWAMVQNNLGLAYAHRIRGDRAHNIEKAIAAYEAALMVRSEALPLDWAKTQTNLGAAYGARKSGEHAENLTKAIAAYEAALTVRTREALPLDHLRTGRLLGRTLLEARQWRRAGLAYASAREAFLALFGEGLNDVEARELIAEAGPLFAEAAFAAAQRGESEEALTLAGEGRARLMAVALKQQVDNRPRVVELRRAIREQSRMSEVTTGLDRTAAIDRLVALRGNLLDLVKSVDRAHGGNGSALTQARAAATSGAVVVPILTKVGAKILIVAGTAPGLMVLDLPELTVDRLEVLLRGNGKDGTVGGWLNAYNINYLQGIEQNERWPEWLKAVSDLGPELWGLVGARIDAALKQNGVKHGSRLIWLPTGGLGILPLGLAQEPVSKRRLAEDYEIVYAPSLEALTTAQRQIANTTAATLAAIVNPTDDLPGTENEGRFVAAHFPANKRTVLKRAAATPEAVLAALKGRSHWHFASHGTFSWQDARQSALVMHGRAPLSVGRLLETGGLGRPRLVVLSACETGLYDISRNPDEFIGLPGTFTALGAAGVLGTLWPVSDAATALLIARFYELHMGLGLPPPTALSRAQSWLRHATNADLAVYARRAAKQGRLESRQIEDELSEEGLNRSRNRTLVEWIARDGGAVGDKKDEAPRPVARPYAHPYYWAGFIYTGL